MLPYTTRIVACLGLSLLATTVIAGTVLAGSPGGPGYTGESAGAAKSASEFDGVAQPGIWSGGPSGSWSGGPPPMPAAARPPSRLPQPPAPVGPPFFNNFERVAGDGVSSTPPAGPTGRQPQPVVLRSGILSQHRTDDAYLLDIDTARLRPEQVQVAVTGRALVVRIGHQAERRRETVTGDGRGAARAYSWSSGSSVRRLPVPPDGDLAAMTREDGPDRVRIAIPRRAMAPAPDFQPSRP